MRKTKKAHIHVDMDDTPEGISIQVNLHGDHSDLTIMAVNILQQMATDFKMTDDVFFMFLRESYNFVAHQEAIRIDAGAIQDAMGGMQK